MYQQLLHQRAIPAIPAPLFNPLLFVETPYITPESSPEPKTPEQVSSPSSSYHTPAVVPAQLEEQTVENPQPCHPKQSSVYSQSSDEDAADEYNHSQPTSPTLSSTIAKSLASSITAFKEEIFEPWEPECVELVDGLLIDWQVLVWHIIDAICHNLAFLPILEANFDKPTYYRERVDNLRELHWVYRQREHQEAYCLASIIDPGANACVWEQFFNNQLAQQQREQQLPPYKEAVVVAAAPLPALEEEDLLHSNNTSNVSLVSSHSGIILQAEREE